MKKSQSLAFSAGLLLCIACVFSTVVFRLPYNESCSAGEFLLWLMHPDSPSQGVRSFTRTQIFCASAEPDVQQDRFAHQRNTRLPGASLGLHDSACPSAQRSSCSH